MACAWAARAPKRQSRDRLSSRRRILTLSKKGTADFTSEEVSDGEFEQVGLVDVPPGERKARLETQRAERREPAQADPDAVEQAQRQVAAALAALEDVLALGED